MLDPATVCEPDTSNIAPSIPIKPSPPTVTFGLTSGEASYAFVALALVNVTLRFSTCHVVERSPVKLPFALTVSV